MTSPGRLQLAESHTRVDGWLPEGKRAAIVLSIDDVHPGTSADAYEAGGDLGDGALGQIEWLLERHPELRVTLFVTADWREINPFPTRKLLARLPWIRDRVYLSRILPAGTMRLDRHPAFVAYLRSLPRVEVGHHGLHHVNRGNFLPVEFRARDRAECAEILRGAMRIFEEADLPVAPGLQAPGWELSDALAQACADVGLRFVCSARDVVTEVSEDARTAMSGLTGVPLIHPVLLGDGALVHIPSNFHATSRPDRAMAILEGGGVLAIKAHIVKRIGSYVARDGVDELYANYLDLLFSELESRYGSSLWWATMGEVAARVHAAAAPTDDPARG